MKKKSSITVHSSLAQKYDKQVKEYNNFIHDLLFGLMYEFVLPKQKLLDIGIGTGLSSIRFSELGAAVYGLDASKEMIDLCKAKSFAKQLKILDITKDTIPYRDGFFNITIAIGVFNFFPSLNSIFNQINRIIKKNGIFAFTILPNIESPKTEKKRLPIFTKQETPWGVPIYKHSSEYIRRLLKSYNFELLKEQFIVVKTGHNDIPDMLLSIIIVRSNK